MQKKETLHLSACENDLQIAADILSRGGTVIFPTETVYGLGANALLPEATKKIFAAKGRPSDNPLIVHIAERKQLASLVKEIPEVADTLIDAFWPGPLTLIFKKSDLVPKTVTGGLNTVAIRMPAQPVARQLLVLADIPVAAPSANLSGKPSPTNFSHVKHDMDGRVDAMIDGGNSRVGLESTVLDISGEIPVLYRPGGVTLEQLEALIGHVQVVTKAAVGETPKSPGLKYKHYAPDANIQILHGSTEQALNYCNSMARYHKVGVLTFDEFPSYPNHIITYSLGSIKKPEYAANRLFAALREMDLQQVEYIFAPEIPETGVWMAVKNRLYRAAGETIIDLTKQILFVCTGNTCRSPMAEAIFRQMTNAQIPVSSAGIFADGAPVSCNTISAMQEVGINISQHSSIQITREMIENAKLILTMTTSHARMLSAAFPEFKEKIQTLANWAKGDGDVSDPFGGDLDTYRQCRDEITQMIQKGLENDYDTN